MGCSGSSQAVKPFDSKPTAQSQTGHLTVQKLHPISFIPKENKSPNSRSEEPGGFSSDNRDRLKDPQDHQVQSPIGPVEIHNTSRSQEERRPGDGQPHMQPQDHTKAKQFDLTINSNQQNRASTFSEKEKNSTTGEVDTSRAYSKQNSKRSLKKERKLYRIGTVQDEQLRKISECASVNEQSAKEDDRISRSMGSIPRWSRSSFAQGSAKARRNSMLVQKRTEAQVNSFEIGTGKGRIKSNMQASGHPKKPCGQRRSEFLGLPPEQQPSNRPSIFSSPTQFSVFAMKFDAHKLSPFESSRKTVKSGMPQKISFDGFPDQANKNLQRVPSFDSL